MLGTYRNLGYGADIELCVSAAKSPSPACAVLVMHLNNTFPSQLAATDLVWAWDYVLADYVMLTHFDGAVFNVPGSWIAMVCPISQTPTIECIYSSFIHVFPTHG
jgi:hypothetical protein